MTLRVAIIEDSRELALEIKNHVEKHNMKVVAMSHDGKDGLQVINECEFDLLLLDLILPHIDGLTLLQNYIPKDHKYKIICFSAFGNESVLSEALSLGVDYFLLKPIDFDVIINAILRTCHIEQAEEEAHVLTHLGFPPKLKGTGYLMDALKIISDENEKRYHLTIKLYPEIAERNDVKTANVERSIRHAIEKAWDGELRKVWEKNGKYMKPSIGELLEYLSEE